MNKNAFPHITLAAFLTGLLSPFTVSLVGAMPAGEIVLLLVAAWMALYLLLEHHFPGHLLNNRMLRLLLISEGIALLGYMISDTVWQSTAHDTIRGWARMIFLGIDILTLWYLFAVGGQKPLVWLLWGEVIGGMIQPLIIRPIFGDYWKFGFGGPVTLAVMLVVSRLGFWPGQVALLGLSALHFAMNFRSVGSVCLLVAVLVTLQRFPLRWRLLFLPVGGALAALALAFITTRSASVNRSHDLRSDISRTAMLKTAWRSLKEHPFIGNGSWFGKSDVVNNFLELRYEMAVEAHLGGIGRESVASDEEQPYAIHSQILVAMAEGGILGGTFFVVYGVLLFAALIYCIVFKAWNAYSGLYLYLMVTALFNLFMSPFSGVHRVYIATASCLLLMIWQEYSARGRRQTVSGLRPRWELPRPAPGPVAFNS